MRRLLPFLLVCLLPFGVQAQNAAPSMVAPNTLPAGLYTLDENHTSITWRVSHLGLSQYTARFTKAKAELVYNAIDPTQSKLVATIDPTSVRTDYPGAATKDFDKELGQGEQWFNAGKFPTIRFESTKIERTGERTANIIGNLTMLGVTAPLTLRATFNGAYLEKPFAKVPALGFSATATLKRSAWGFATYVPMIGDEVQIQIETELHHSPVTVAPAATPAATPAAR